MKIQYIIAVAAVVVSIFAVFGLVSNQGNIAGVSSDAGQNLIAPAFAQSSDASFLETTAGIAAYVDLNKTISLPNSSAILNGEAPTKSYVNGLIRFPDQEAYHYAKYFVHENGWIVVYYPKDAPSAKMIDVKNYKGGVLNTNNLQLGLNLICEEIGESNCNASYYHFQYPKANKILLAIKDKGEMTVTIPSDTVVYEKSLSVFPQRSHCAEHTTVSGQAFNGCGTVDNNYIIPSTLMKADEMTKINNSRYPFAFSALYKE